LRAAALTDEEKSVTYLPHLLITKGPQAGASILLDFKRLESAPLVLGRLAGECDFVLQSFQNKVSRKHASFSYRAEDQLVILADAGSSNGTQVNGEYIAGPTVLFPGDTVGCGDVELVFVIPIPQMGLPLAKLPGQTERKYLEDSEPGVARLEIVASRAVSIRPGSFCRLTPGHSFLIGRFGSSDLPLLEEGENARLVSRRHAEIRWSSSGYIIRDLGAANPAWVNQSRLDAPRLLEDGDSIQVGSTLLRYRASRLPLVVGVTTPTTAGQTRTYILKGPPTQALLSGPHLLSLPTNRQILIGRAEGNDMRLLDRSISRRHARLFYEARHFFLSDLGSANGTRHNGREITEPVVLQPGDRLQFGNFEFVLQEESIDSEVSSKSLPLPLVEPVVYRLSPVEFPKEAAPDSDGSATQTVHPTPRQDTTATPPISHPLRNITPFDELDSQSFLLLAPHFKEVSYKPGQEIVREGQGRGAFLAILEGRVSVSRALNERQRLVAAELTAGSVFGERTVMEDMAFANRLEAVTPVRALRLEENIFKREFGRNRAIQTFFQQQVSAASATNWLRATLLMRTLSEKTRHAMANRLRYRVYNPGETLAERGHPAEEFFLMLSGAAVAYVADVRGGESPLATLEEGDTFGDGIVAPGETYPMTVRAERKVACYVLARPDFENVLAKSGDPVASLGAGLGGLPLGAVLNRVGPFMQLPPQLVTKIGAEMKPKFFKKGETIVRQNEPASAFYIIRSGQVEVSFRTSGGEDRSDMRLGPGQYFGEASLLTNTARADTVKAAEDCELLALYRNKLEGVLKLGESYDLGQYFAKGLTKRFRPKRIEEVLVSQQTNATGEVYYLLSRDGGEQFFKLSDRSLFLWNLMDGDNSLNDLSMAYFLEFKKLDLEGVSNLVGQLQAANFLEIPPIDEKFVDPNEGKRTHGPLWRIFNWRYEFKHIDRFFGRLYNFGGKIFFWPPVSWLLWAVILTGFGAFLYSGLFGPASSDLGLVRIFQGGGLGALTVPGALPFWALLVVLLFNFIIHELAHGLACKAYGRRVISGGFGLQLGWPFFFVNTNEIWLEKRRPRIVVNLAGPASNALLAGICCLAMLFTSDPALRMALFQVAAIAYVLVYININPLMELDGYFALMDWLEIPGLRRKALTYIRRRVLGRPQPGSITRRERRIFFWYALLTPLYILFTMVQFSFFLESLAGPPLNEALKWLGVDRSIGDGLIWVLALGITALLAWPYFTELLTIGRDEDEVAGSRARRRKLR
jgi:putative peptide zinc metalloprotease protein